MKTNSRWAAGLAQRLGMAVLLLLCSAVGANAWADPPGRVGRLGDIEGQVWLYTPDAGEWISAVRNRPLTTGDRLATEANSRAELRIGSTTVRLDGGTELEMIDIDDEHVALQLHNGSVGVHLRSNEAVREFEMNTAEGRFVANRPGRYRIDRMDDTSSLTVWTGEAVYEGSGSALTVMPGQRAEFWLDRNNAAQYSITDPVRDNFAAWTSERERRDERSTVTRYVSPEMTGVEDLDRYGRWEQAPDYGAIWVPQGLPVGWAPYSMGHWAWVSPWGWTWIDDAPWGFAPFHYGRWAMVRDRWCWVPGTYVRRPVYAPALVGWVGGPRFSLTVTVGGRSAPAVGWFPLAPHEVFVPTYRVSPHYVQQVNITHVTRITNVTMIVNNPQQAVTAIDYQYRKHPNAVTVVPQSVMVNREPVAPSASQFRSSNIIQQLVRQPQQNVVVATPQVAAPPITPAIAQARRMAPPAERGRPGVPARPAVATPVAPLVVPAPPNQAPNARAHVERDRRAPQAQEQERRRDDERVRVPGSPPERPRVPNPQPERAPATPLPGVTVAPPVAPRAAPPGAPDAQAAPQARGDRPVPPPPGQARGQDAERPPRGGFGLPRAPGVPAVPDTRTPAPVATPAAPGVPVVPAPAVHPQAAPPAVPARPVPPPPEGRGRGQEGGPPGASRSRADEIRPLAPAARPPAPQPQPASPSPQAAVPVQPAPRVAPQAAPAAPPPAAPQQVPPAAPPQRVVPAPARVPPPGQVQPQQPAQPPQDVSERKGEPRGPGQERAQKAREDQQERRGDRRPE